MKKSVISTAIMFLVSLTTYCQGVVDFANLASGVNVPANDLAGTSFSGNAWLADLFFAADSSGNVIPLGSMTDAGLAQPFLTGAEASYFADPTGVNLNTGGQIEFEVVIWQSAVASTWAQATSGPFTDPSINYFGNGGEEIGFSNPFLLTPNNSPSPASPLVGLASFNFIFSDSPEPSTFAIGGLGAVMVLFFGRRKYAKSRQI